MPLLEWTDALATGIESIDKDHKVLVKMLNDLFDAVSTGKGRDVLAKVLGGLIAYTKTHFAREQKYMAIHQYADAAAHIKLHVEISQQVLEVQQQYESGATAVLGLEVLNFLRKWLVNHIQGTDQKLGKFLSSKGEK